MRLESKPYGNVNVEVQASCKDGKAPKVTERQGQDNNDKIYECFDGDTATATEPLASIKVGSKNYWAHTLTFDESDWNTLKEVKL